MTQLDNTRNDGGVAAEARQKIRLRPIALKVHRWAALAAMLWLIVLGLTGFLLNNAQWRWLQQVTVTEAFASKHVLQDEALGTIIRKFQVNRATPGEMLGGGWRGLWRSTDSGKRWTPVPYPQAEGTPQLFELVPDSGEPWHKIYLATDDGIWLVDGARGPAMPLALRGQRVTHLARGAGPRELVGAVDRSAPFRLSLDDANSVTWLGNSEIQSDSLPAEISLARLMTDLHLGFGLAGNGWARVINDYGSLAMVVLSTTGFLLWFLPRYWRRRNATPEPKKRRSAAAWVFRGHAPIIGLLAVIPMTALILSGFYFSHVESLLKWSSQVRFRPSALLTPYAMPGLDDEINGVMASPGHPAYLAVMTRLGILETADNGESWRYDPGTPLPAHTKAGFVGVANGEGYTFVGAHGGPNFYRADGDAAWHEIPGLRMMIQDAARTETGWLFKGSRGFFEATLSGDLSKTAVASPDLPGLPLYNFATDLHSGAMFTEAWTWVNDVVCALALFLIATGLVNWWHRRWR